MATTRPAETTATDGTDPTSQRLTATIASPETTAAFVETSSTTKTIETIGATRPRIPAADAGSAWTETATRTATTTRTAGSEAVGPTRSAESRKMTETAMIAAPRIASQG